MIAAIPKQNNFDHETTGDKQGRAMPAPLDALKKALKTRVYVDNSVKHAMLEFFSLHDLRAGTWHKKILCLLAHRGMGKKTIVYSLCSALSWKLVRIPIGEMKNDDGTVLGNRRSDINAVAAKIIHILHEVGPANTIVLLENLDKLDTTGLNNPTVDFFEVLNYMQDYAIKNKYQAKPIDVSRTRFIATASTLSAVPQGMVDQMVTVNIPSYTDHEKIRFTRNAILPGLLKEYGLEDCLFISDNAVLSIIRGYTNEAGIADLRKKLNLICKTAALRMNHQGSIIKKIRIHKNHLSGYLGAVRYPVNEGEKSDIVGLVKVLGQSGQGGCTLMLEMLALKGDGGLTFTGNIDKIFQESAMVAIDYVRTCAARYGIKENFHKEYDLHLHVLKGSTPKFGVSAGVAIATGVVSALSGKPVRGDVAMTGEISLHGKVLGVRSIRDKVLGAARAGVKTVFLPRNNETDVRHLPKEIKKQINIVLVDDVDTVLTQAILWE